MSPSTGGAGRALRNARLAHRLPLSEVAAEARISVATLSRIENEKQSIDVGLFLRLATIVGANPVAVLSGSDEPHETPRDLARLLAARTAAELAEIFADTTRHAHRTRPREPIALQFESVLAAVDLLIEEIRELRKRSR